jgi:hypothetical protein
MQDVSRYISIGTHAICSKWMELYYLMAAVHERESERDSLTWKQSAEENGGVCVTKYAFAKSCFTFSSLASSSEKSYPLWMVACISSAHPSL